jgi:hypothetical protein
VSPIRWHQPQLSSAGARPQILIIDDDFEELDPLGQFLPSADCRWRSRRRRDRGQGALGQEMKATFLPDRARMADKIGLNPFIQA